MVVKISSDQYLNKGYPNPKVYDDPYVSRSLAKVHPMWGIATEPCGMAQKDSAWPLGPPYRSDLGSGPLSGPTKRYLSSHMGLGCKPPPSRGAKEQYQGP